jgi:hypothetical protein
MGFFCMVVLDVSIFNCFSHFSCNVMFESDFIVQAVFLPLHFFVADLVHHFWDEEESLSLCSGEVCCC